MEGDKGDNDQSDDIKSNEAHSDKKLPILYHSKLIGASGKANPKIWSCSANFSVFIDYKRNQFLKK